MTQTKFRLVSPLNPAIAELRSEDKQSAIRITFSGYQFPKFVRDSDWYRILFEYEGGREYYKNETCRFDAESFVQALKNIKKLRGTDEVKHLLLAPPYGPEELKIEYRNPKRTSRQGLYVTGEIGNFSFRFKTNRICLWDFYKRLEEATRLLPIRTDLKDRR